MIDLIYQYYNIDVIGIIKISPYAFKIKSVNQFYVAKIVNNHELEKIFHHIAAMQLNILVKVLLNINHQYLTAYNQQFFYLMPFLENDNNIINEIKIKNYFELISQLHLRSFHTIKVNEEYFQQLHEQLLKNIQERLDYYQQLILNYEKISFLSPSQWYFVMHYHHIYQALENSHNYLIQFLEFTKCYTNIRVCYNYLNFDFKHILMHHHCLISLDHICLQMPVFDLFYVFQNNHFSLFDADILFNHYFCDITLKDYEIILLKCLLTIVPYIEFKNNEVDNIYLCIQLLNYIDAVEHFIHQI